MKPTEKKCKKKNTIAAADYQEMFDEKCRPRSSRRIYSEKGRASAPDVHWRRTRVSKFLTTKFDS